MGIVSIQKPQSTSNLGNIEVLFGSPKKYECLE
jgi:hypothetical protein